MEKSLNQTIKKATKWATITELATKLVSPVTNAVLARILVPEAFGVVATLTMVTSFAEVFTDAGFQKYIVQHEFTDDEDLDLCTNVAFWTNIVFSFIIWSIIVLLATPIANLVGSSGHEASITVMSAEIPLLAFSSIQLARYRREFDFKNLFVVRMLVAMVPLLITVPIAFIFRSHWALVIGTLVKDLLNATFLTIRSKWKPSFRYSCKKLKEMLSFSLWTVLENVTIWLGTNAGTFIVSNIMGSYYLGMYKTSISTIGGYYAIIQSATMPVLFSALSRYQQNESEFQEVLFRFQRIVALLVFPIGFGLLVYNQLGTMILLGSQWTMTANFVGLYALSCSFVFVFSYYNSEAFRSKGRPILSVIAQIIYLLILVPMLYVSAKRGYVFLCVSTVLSRLTLILATSAIAEISLHIKFKLVVKNVWPSLLSSAVMAFFGYLIRMALPGICWEIFTVFLCVIVYVGCLFLLPSGRKQLSEIPVIHNFMTKKTRKKF